MTAVAAFPAADPQRVERELLMAILQTSDLLEEAVTKEDSIRLLAALAFLHIRFERVHPFLDGNGRTGCAVLAAQFAACFGNLPSFENQQAYRGALRASTQRNLTPLINFLGESAGVSVLSHPWPAPFRLAPRFLEEQSEPSLLDDMAWSRQVR
jgi:fido (protein-threonine AMPylation protein)